MRWRNRTWLVSRLREILTDEANKDEGHKRSSAQDAETLASWTEAARDRGAVLFVGAGWTRNADPALRPYDSQEHDKPLPLLWNELVNEMHAELEHDLGEDGTTDPLWLAELHRQRFGEDALMRLLRRAVPDERLRPGAMHDALRSIRWKAILTGNYDTLLEKTFAPFQRVRVCVDDTDLVRSAEREAVELIHLHGVLERPKTIVLALEDYRRYPAKHPGMLAKVRQLFLQHPVLFVGFGVTDPNFMQWSGWLADVVGQGKNPWVNLTLDPPPSLSHGRYWGTRLDFVSIRPFPRFRDAVPRLFAVLGEALDDESRSEEVAWLRLRASKSAAGVIREVRDLLATGDRIGAEGDDWDYFRSSLVDAAASRVLELAKLSWHEPSDDEREQMTRGVTIQIDARPLDQRERGDALNKELERAFGAEWGAWLETLRGLFGGQYWSFHRVDLRRQRHADIWNRAVVRLREEGVCATEGGDESLLTKLRSGDQVAAPTEARSANELRFMGYLAAQAGDWPAAAKQYEKAVTASRAEYEPLRTEFLTARSRTIAVERCTVQTSKDDAAAAREELKALRNQLREMRGTLARLPSDARLDGLSSDETEAERKLAAQLSEDLGRVDVDRTTRLGNLHGPAARWLDRVERLFLAPGTIGDAADALGSLQWRYDDHRDAVLTLSRYGSKRLETLVRLAVQNADADPSLVVSLIPELLRRGRWPGEWLARIEALMHVLPSCTSKQLLELGAFIEAARDAILAAPAGVVRGSATEYPWSARGKVERLEASRWNWLPAASAVTAIESWTEKFTAAPTHTFVRTGVLEKLEGLPWKAWKETGELDGARIRTVLISLIDARRAPSAEPFDSAEAEGFIDLTAALLRSGVFGIPIESELDERIQQLLAAVGSPRRLVLEASLAEVTGDQAKQSAIAARAAESLSVNDRATLRASLDAIASAATLPTNNKRALLEALHVLTRKVDESRMQTDSASNSDDERLTYERARVVAFVIGRLLTRPQYANDDDLARLGIEIVKAAPFTAEYLTTIDAAAAALPQAVDEGLLRVLRGSEKVGLLTRRVQQFAGLRGVVRALVQVGPERVNAEWLANVCLLARSDKPDVAQYATWILGEWAARGGPSASPQMAAGLVLPALRAAASDRRIGIQANGVRGLVLLRKAEGVTPFEIDSEIIRLHAGDERVAFTRALDGVGFF